MDWFLTVFVNFEGVAGDGWGFQGYHSIQGTFGCNIQAKKNYDCLWTPLSGIFGAPQTPQNQPDPYNGPSPPLFIEYY